VVLTPFGDGYSSRVDHGYAVWTGNVGPLAQPQEQAVLDNSGDAMQVGGQRFWRGNAAK
jgi:hypothetical protein